MGWTDWFRKRSREVAMDYRITDDGFKCLSDDGRIVSINWKDLVRVKIITTVKQHPKDEDLYWAFADDQHEYIVPNCKDVYGVLPHLHNKFPGFRQDVMLEAMAGEGTGKEYVCWKRQFSRRLNVEVS